MVRTSDILKSGVLIVGEAAADLMLVERMLRSAGYKSVASTRKPRAVAALHRRRPYGLAVLIRPNKIEPDASLPVLEIGKPFDRVAVLTRVRDALKAGLLRTTVGTPIPRRTQRGLGGERGPR
jgi:CheY-like chemotaxis protein